MPIPDDILTMPLPELKKRAEQVLALYQQIDTLLPGLLGLTHDARIHTHGRFRNGEAEALMGLLDVADAKPALFEILKDQDEGIDPTKFEPGLLRDRLARAVILGPLVALGDEISLALSDTRLHLGDLTKPVLLAMYAIVKPQAKHDTGIATLCKAAIDFFAKVGQAAAETRKKKAAALKKP